MADKEKNSIITNVKPHSNEAESALLGCMLIDRDIIERVSLKLSNGSSFYNAINGFIFDMIVELNSISGNCDLISLNDYYERKKSKTVSHDKKKTFGEIYKDVDFLEYLTALVTGVVSAANYEMYLSIVYRDAKLRTLIDVCNDTIVRAYTATDLDELFQYAEKSIFEISQEGQDYDLAHISKATAQVMSHIEQMARDKDAASGLRTGFSIFDSKTRGLNRANLIVLAARPGVGKTTFALNVLLNISHISADKQIAMFSVEMSRKELALRLMANESQVPMNMIQAGATNEGFLKKIWQSTLNLSESSIYVDDSGELTPEALISKCRRLIGETRKPIDLVIIDYLQLMNGGKEFEGKDNRNQEISKISRKLKIFAKELNCPVLALSQMSRNIDKRDSKIPVLSDLRESGAIEQDADLVMFLYGDEDPRYQGSIILDVAKHRSGEIFKERLDFLRETNRFRESKDQNIDESYFKANNSGKGRGKGNSGDDGGAPAGFTAPTGN